MTAARQTEPHLHSPTYPSDGLIRTNPVWSLARIAELCWVPLDWRGSQGLLARYVRHWADRGVVFPRAALADWITGQHLPDDYEIPAGEQAGLGVIGLAVDVERQVGFVNPLSARLSPSGWRISPRLPFQRETIQDEIVRLLEQSGRPLDGSGKEIIPEALAFQIDEQLGRETSGSSMDVAALLAVLGALYAAARGGRSPLLRCACAIVEPDQGDGLRPVGAVALKLAAVVRESDSRTLLIRHPDCAEADPFDRQFDVVWRVTSFRELAACLDEAGLLQPLLEGHRLTPAELGEATHRLRQLTNQPARHAEALGLARRLAHHAQSQTLLPTRSSMEIAQTISDLYRHLGHFDEAVASAEELCERSLRQPKLFSYDEAAQAVIQLAAACFDQHDFERMRELLGSQVELMLGEPRRCRLETRCMAFNTLGRALSICGVDGWRALFEHSLVLQEASDPANMPRTRNYLIHALLRGGQLAEAETEIERNRRSLAAEDRMSAAFLDFYQADLARRAGSQWVAAESDRSGLPRYLEAFYQQAVARQPGRAAKDAVDRLELAAGALEEDARACGPLNVLHFLSGSLRLALAAYRGDAAAGRAAGEQLRAYFSQPQCLQLKAYYDCVLSELPEAPSRADVERLFERAPFF